nr:hypothetical protein [Tanacetum cinerariifolium]
MPYRIYEKLGIDQVKPVCHIITMLDYSKAEPMGILKDVLCQVGVTMILAKIWLLDIPVDRDIPIVVGRRFLYTCWAIINIIKGTTLTFYVVCHQKFYVANVRNSHGESDSDDEEEYCLKRDEIGNHFYGPNRLESVEARLLVYKKNKSVYEEDIKIVDKCKTSLGYNVVPAPYTGNSMPPKLNLSGLEEFVNEPIVSEPTIKKPIVETSEAKASADKTKVVRKNFGPPLIEDCISKSVDEAE